MKQEIYIPTHFSLFEVIDKELYTLFNTLGTNNKDVLWRLFDPSVLRAADWLRGRYGRATVNNWKHGGDRSQSGLRTTTSPWYSPTSMHSVGKALDIVFDNITAEEIRADLKAQPLIPYIKRIEDKVNWLHIDTKEVGHDGIYFFNP